MKLLVIINDTLIDNSKLALETTVLTRASSATTETILTETQSHPTLTEIEASSILAKEASVLSRLSSASGDTIDNIASSASSIINRIDGDSYIDITTTPWEEIVKQKGMVKIPVAKARVFLVGCVRSASKSHKSLKTYVLEDIKQKAIKATRHFAVVVISRN